MLPVEGVEAQVGGKSVEGSNCVVVRPVDHPEAEPILDSMEQVLECPRELPDESLLGLRKTSPWKKKMTNSSHNQESTHHYPPRFLKKLFLRRGGHCSY